jgi:1-acyl-sn-glycerol-3-phosphate acyltransferase
LNDGTLIAPNDGVWKGSDHPTWLYRSVQFVLGPILRFLFATRRRNVKAIPKKGPVILVSNHASNLDPVIVVSSIRRPVYHLGKHTLFTKPFRRWFFETLGGQIPVDRDRGGNEAAVLAGVQVLEDGRALGIYPEGTRTPDGRLGRGRTGVARLALTTGAMVVPVAVKGTYQIWPKGRRLPRLFRRTEVIVGSPRAYGKDPQLANNTAELRRITDELMLDLAKLLGEPYDPETAVLFQSKPSDQRKP